MPTYTLFNQAIPGSVTSGAGNNGTNGLHFTVAVPSTLNGIWHYSPSPSTQLPTTIGLYTVTTLGTSGSLVHSESPSWSGAAGSGWVFSSFSSPPSLAAGTDYMATQFRNDAVNEWFCDYPVTWPVLSPATTGIINAPKDESTSALSQGWYNIGTSMVFPTTQTGTAGNNFGMDVSISPTGVYPDQFATGVAQASVSSSVYTWPTNPTAGSKVVIELSTVTQAVVSAVDNGTSPTTFTADFSLAPGANSGKYILRGDNITLPSSGSYHVTVTFAGSTSFTTGAGASYLGAAPGASTGATSNTGTSSSVTTGNITPSAVGALIIGSFTDDTSISETITLTTTGANTIFNETDGVNFFAGGFAYKVATTTSAQGLAWTLGDAPSWGGYIAVYAPAATLSPFSPPTSASSIRRRISRKNRSLTSKGSPVNPGASPFKPPTVSKNRHGLSGKSKTSASKGSPFVAAGPPSPFTPPKVSVNRHGLTKKTRYSSSKGSPVSLPAPPSPFAPPKVSANRHQLDRKSRTSSSKGSPATVIPVTPSPFAPPTKANKGKAKTAESRTYGSKGSPYTPSVSPFIPPTKANRGKTAAVRSRHRKSPAPYITGVTLLHASVTITAYPLVVAPDIDIPLHLATSTVTAYPVNAIPPTMIALPTATVIVTAHRMYPPNPLIMSLAPNSGTDQFGNAYVAGFHIYSGTTNGSVISLQSTNATFGAVPTVTFLPPGVTNVTLVPQSFGYTNSAGASSQQTWMIHSSGKTNSKDDAAIQLVGQSGDSSNDATIIFEFGGAVATTLKKTTGFSNPAWTNVSSFSNGWTGSGAGGIAGVRYRINTAGYIEIQGDILSASAGTSTTVFTLPSGFRPTTGSQNFPAGWNNPATSNSASVPWVNILNTGVVSIAGYESTSKEVFFHIFCPVD